MSKRVIVSSNFFFTIGSQTILVFLYQTSWQLFRRDRRRNGGVKCRWGRHKSRFWTNSWLSIDDCCSAINNWRSSVQWCITVTVHVCLRQKPPCINEYAEKKRREQNSITRSGKSEAEVTSNRTFRWTYCTIEADRHETPRGLSATAGLPVL